jgi:hypothetical protein
MTIWNEDDYHNCGIYAKCFGNRLKQGKSMNCKNCRSKDIPLEKVTFEEEDED